MKNLTEAQWRALQAVKGGHVTRIYDRGGNVFRGPKGIGTQCYWALERLGMIKDGKSSGGAFVARCPVMLSDAGMNFLWGNPQNQRAVS